VIARRRLDASARWLRFPCRRANADPSRSGAYASLVGGDGKLCTVSARGEVTVLAATSELRVFSSVDLDERLMAVPAAAEGTLRVWTESRLRAFGSGD